MRLTPIVGTKAWFGPRKFGWGLEPVSVEGWALTALVLTVGVVTRKRESDKQISRLLSIALVAVSLLKGTAPGGPKARKQFNAARG